MLAAAVISAGGMDKKLFDALKKGAPRVLLQGGGKAAEAAADKVVAEAIVKHGVNGAEDLAGALAANGTIGEYSVMARFTKGLGSRWQAHHILEEAVAKNLGLAVPERVPSVILSDAEHKLITAQLKAAGTQQAKNAAQLWQAYKKAYAKYPAWLKAIEPYFRSVP